jgi:hypothetical protein
VAHADWSVGDSITLLLGIKGVNSSLATDVFAVRGSIAITTENGNAPQIFVA